MVKYNIMGLFMSLLVYLVSLHLCFVLSSHVYCSMQAQHLFLIEEDDEADGMFVKAEAAFKAEMGI